MTGSIRCDVNQEPGACLPRPTLAQKVHLLLVALCSAGTRNDSQSSVVNATVALDKLWNKPGGIGWFIVTEPIGFQCAEKSAGGAVSELKPGHLGMIFDTHPFDVENLPVGSSRSFH